MSISKYKNILILSTLFLVGFFLRVYLLDKNLFFGPEQGRDMLVVRDIVIDHKLVLIGPKTAVEGLFHGPLYYYVATLPFLLSQGNPLFIAQFFIFLNSLSVFFTYLLGKEMFSRRIGLIASTLFAFSFGSVVMSRWLSHPPLIIPISCLFFLFLVRFIKGKNIYLIWTAILYGLASQVEFTDFALFSFILLFTVIIFWKKFIRRTVYLITSLILIIFLPIINFILFDLRHNFLIANSFIKSQAHRPDFIGYLWLTLVGSFTQFINVFRDTVVMSVHPTIAILIFIFATFFLIRLVNKNKIGVYILLIWIFSPFVAYVLLRYNPLYHYFTASIVGIIILTSVLINYIFSWKKILGFLVVILLVLISLFSLFNYLPSNKNVFFQSTQPDLKYQNQVLAIKEIYKEADGKPFSFQAFTVPYWLQDGWEYLFWYFGTTKYGFVPTDNKAKSLFVIIQEDLSNEYTTRYQKNWLKNTVSTWGTKENEFRFGILRVQRLITI